MMTSTDFKTALQTLAYRLDLSGEDPKVREEIALLVHRHFPATDPSFAAEQEKLAGYELSENQLDFIADCLSQDLEVYYSYSGRGMYGSTCPAVDVDRGQGFNSQSNFCEDSMGLGRVYYAKR